VLASTNLKEVLEDKNLEKTFRYIDTDGSNGISMNELKNRLGDHISDKNYMILVK
jgi:Ca2+-binding EF-hand superfamily protein